MFEYELCKESSCFLIDLCRGSVGSWRKARAEFKSRGYHGKYLLIRRSYSCGNFKIWNIQI